MRYEVAFGDFTHWCEAGNQFQACLLALREAAEQTDAAENMPTGMMLVTNMDSGEEETIPFSEILALQYAVNNGEPIDVSECGRNPGGDSGMQRPSLPPSLGSRFTACGCGCDSPGREKQPVFPHDRRGRSWDNYRQT